MKRFTFRALRFRSAVLELFGGLVDLLQDCTSFFSILVSFHFERTLSSFSRSDSLLLFLLSFHRCLIDAFFRSFAMSTFLIISGFGTVDVLNKINFWRRLFLLRYELELEYPCTCALHCSLQPRRIYACLQQRWASRNTAHSIPDLGQRKQP